MLTRIRNAHRALLPSLDLPHSRMKESIAGILKREGYIADFAVEGKTVAKKLSLKLKYEGRKGVIEGLRRVSTPGQEEEGTSLQTQEALCRAHAEQHGYAVDENHVYRDVFTGTEWAPMKMMPRWAQRNSGRLGSSRATFSPGRTPSSSRPLAARWA